MTAAPLLMAIVGDVEGDAVCFIDGDDDGLVVGNIVGFIFRFIDGNDDGLLVRALELRFVGGDDDGLVVGNIVGFTAGFADGGDDGLVTGGIVGFVHGDDDGLVVRVIVGVAVGANDGETDGDDDGLVVRVIVGVVDGDDDVLAVGVTAGTNGFADGKNLGAVGTADESLAVYCVGLAVGRFVGGSDGAVMLTMDNMCLLNFRKSRVPRPLTGSHPVAALKPCLQHTVNLVQLFFPIVTSFMKRSALEYRMGLMKPRGLPPPLSRAALTNDTMAAIIGADAEVPSPLASPP